MYQESKPCLLVHNDLRNATGCGVDRTVSEATRSGYQPAAPQGLVAAPIMTNKMSLSQACRVEQGNDIGSGGLGPVVASSSRSSGGGVTPLRRSQRSQSFSVEPACDGFEAARLLGKSVQQHDCRRVGRSRVDDVKAQTGAQEVIHGSTQSLVGGAAIRRQPQCRLAFSRTTKSPSDAPMAALTKLPPRPSPPRRPARKL